MGKRGENSAGDGVQRKPENHEKRRKRSGHGDAPSSGAIIGMAACCPVLSCLMPIGSSNAATRRTRVASSRGGPGGERGQLGREIRYL